MYRSQVVGPLAQSIRPYLVDPDEAVESIMADPEMAPLVKALDGDEAAVRCLVAMVAREMEVITIALANAVEDRLNRG